MASERGTPNSSTTSNLGLPSPPHNSIVTTFRNAETRFENRQATFSGAHTLLQSFFDEAGGYTIIDRGSILHWTIEPSLMSVPPEETRLFEVRSEGGNTAHAFLLALNADLDGDETLVQAGTGAAVRKLSREVAQRLQRAAAGTTCLGVVMIRKHMSFYQMTPTGNGGCYVANRYPGGGSGMGGGSGFDMFATTPTIVRNS